MALILLLLPATVMLAGGILLLVEGLRGRVIDDHPICRACGFDLFGRPDGVDRCSECGAHLVFPRAVRIGHRRRRPAIAAAGALVLLPFLLLGGLLLWANARNVDWIEYAPHWYVLRQAQSSLPTTRDPALSELLRRQGAGLLSDSQVRADLDAALSLQANRSATWIPRWGDLIEALHASGKVPAERWRAYLVNAPAVSLSLRPEVRRGDRVIFRIDELPARCGSNSRIWASVRFQGQPDCDLIERRDSGSMSGSLSPTGNGSIGSSYDLPAASLAAAPDGPKALHIKAIFDLYANGSSGQGTPDATTSFDLRGTWTLVPADKITVSAITDPVHRPGVESAIHVQSVARFKSNPDGVIVQVRLTSPPVPLAYRVILRSGTRQWPGGSITIPANGSTTWSTGATAKGLDVDRVDVLFEPDDAVARETVDITQYWAGEVVVHGVPVTRNP